MAGDLTNYNSLEIAAAETSAITNGNLDYLIANAAFASPVNGFFRFFPLLEKCTSPSTVYLPCLAFLSTNSFPHSTSFASHCEHYKPSLAEKECSYRDFAQLEGLKSMFFRNLKAMHLISKAQ